MKALQQTCLWLILVTAIGCLYAQPTNWRIAQRYEHISDSMINMERYDYCYNQSHPTKPDSIKMLLCNTYPEPVVWVPTEGYKYYYDASGEYLIAYIDSLYQDSFVKRQITGVYDAQHRLSVMRDDQYNYIIHQHKRFYFNYDNNQLSSYVYYAAEGNVPDVSIARMLYAHDTQGRITSGVYQVSADSVNWSDAYRQNITYNSNDESNGASLIDYLSHNHIEDYIKVADFYYGMVSEIVTQNRMDSLWVDYQKVLYTYDSEGRLIFKTYQNMSDEWGWINSSRYCYLYDEHGNLLQVDFESSYLGEWVDTYTFYQYIWEMTTANEDNVITPVTMSLNTYPNPFNGNLNVSFQTKSKAPIETSIYNLKGQLVKALGMSKSNSLIWDGKDKNGIAVSNGIYFVKAKQDGLSITSKIIKLN